MVKEENCLVRTRIGPVMQNNFDGIVKDQWWRIQNCSNVDKLTIEITNIIENIAIPFLEKFTTIKRINEFIINLKNWESNTPQHLLHTAVIAYQMGRVSEAERIISKIINKYDPWKERCFIAAKNMELNNIS